MALRKLTPADGEDFGRPEREIAAHPDLVVRTPDPLGRGIPIEEKVPGTAPVLWWIRRWIYAEPENASNWGGYYEYWVEEE